MSGTDSNISASFQAFPQASSQVVTANGTMTSTWYRYFETVWRQVCSGCPNSLTVYNAHSIANGAQSSADSASASVTAETQRAEAAEAGLQGQINTNTSAINSINSQISTINSTLTSLQSQINTINQRLANAGIP